MSRWKLTGAVVASLLWPIVASAQVTTATVQGRVLDESSAPMPGDRPPSATPASPGR